MDIEHDELENFVGMAAWDGVSALYYITTIEGVSQYLSNSPSLVGHNLKGDVKLLRKWGINIHAKQMVFDTAIASYITNPPGAFVALKPLAKHVFGYEWPGYKDIVGTGKGKVTLDKQPIELVANYCGMDCFATMKLKQHFDRKLTQNQKRMFGIKMQQSRWLLEAECAGIKVDGDYLKQLDVEFTKEIDAIKETLNTKAVQSRESRSSSGVIAA